MQNSIQSRSTLRSGLWFLAVGGVAALIDFVVFMLACRVVWPDVAKLIGFFVAFWVSFFGHRRLSFKDTSTTAGQSLRRFAVTSLAGFACNQLCFELCYRGTHWPPSLAWLVATALAAGQTFVLSRFWAFRR